MRIGIFGGSFNPLHNGHIAAVSCFRKEVELDMVAVIPCFVSPFKSAQVNEFAATAQHRLEMLRLVFPATSETVIDEYEISRATPSFTADTIEHLFQTYKNNIPEFFLFAGFDQAKSFQKWKNWEWILSKAQLCIASRNESPERCALLAQTFPNTDCIRFLQCSTPDISSSEIRTKLRQGERVRDLVPPKIAEYLQEHKLYD